MLVIIPQTLNPKEYGTIILVMIQALILPQQAAAGAFRFRMEVFVLRTEPTLPEGSKDPNNRVLGPKHHYYSWYLGPKTLSFGFYIPLYSRLISLYIPLEPL